MPSRRPDPPRAAIAAADGVAKRVDGEANATRSQRGKTLTFRDAELPSEPPNAMGLGMDGGIQGGCHAVRADKEGKRGDRGYRDVDVSGMFLSRSRCLPSSAPR